MRACAVALCLAATLGLAPNVDAAGPGGAAPPAPTQLPTGGQVVAGQAQITQNAAAMTVQQGTLRAVVDWQQFNVGSQAQVRFDQPSAAAVTLNRVIGADPSQIMGRISAPGQVFISNPQGVLFGAGASVDVGGLVATTMGIGTADFMAGQSRFERNGSTAGVVNQGQLTATPQGYIALLAPEVRNEGVISARAGTAVLAAGEAITLNFDTPGRLSSITVAPAQIATLVENRRAVLVEGGQIIIAARSAEQLMGSVVNSGELNATSLVQRGGRILLEGDDITLADGSRIEARGTSVDGAGGGTVLIGGDWQGSGTQHQATNVTMAGSATIDVSATQHGDGGTVVLWSDLQNGAGQTSAQGTILARGGAVDGSGGRVETSGHAVDVGGLRVDAGALAGAAGLWLIDPYDYAINAAAASAIGSALNTSNVTVSTTVSNTTYGGGTSNTGNGDISVNSTITKTGSGTSTLTLQAGRRILGSSDIATTNGPLNVVLWANYAAGGGGVQVNNITTRGGSVWVGGSSTAGGNSTWNGLTVGNGPATGVASGNANAIDWYGTINTRAASGGAGGDVLLWANDGVNGGFGLVNQSAAQTLTNAGNVTLRSQTFYWPSSSNPVITSTGTFTVEPNAASFSQGMQSSWFNITGATLGGFTFGKDGSTSQITSDNALTVAGPIKLYGGNLYLNADLTSTLANSAILVKGSGFISTNTGRTLQTNGGPITLWSDTDANGGYIWLNQNATLDSRTQADRTASTNTTGGGKITLAGGADNGSGAPAGYAQGDSGNTDRGGINFGDQTQNGHNNNTQILSGGGDVLLRGKSSNGIMGINWVDGGTLNAGSTGLVSFDGQNTSTGHGIEFGSYGASGSSTTIRSGGGTSGTAAITFSGSTTSTNSGNYGIQSRALTVLATGAGGISVTGSAPSGYGYTGPLDFLAASGPIGISGGNSGINSSNGGTLGKKAATAVLASSSNVTLTGGTLNIGSASTIDTTGTVTLQPFGTSFSSAQTFPSNLGIASTASGLTFGKSGNTADLTLGNAETIAGPISLYGGGITLNADLTSTLSTSPILVKAGASIVTNNIRTLQTNGGAITLWADSDTSGQGFILLNQSATLDSRTAADRTATTNTAGGGRITLAGGNDDGTGAPGGYAISTSSTTDRGGINFGDQTVNGHNNNTQILSGGGNVTIRGSSGTGTMGISWVDSGTVNAGSAGLISLNGVNTSTGHGIEFGAYGVSGSSIVLRSGGGTSSTPAISISGTGGSNGNGVQSTRVTEVATGAGGISISGTTANSSGYGYTGSTDFLAASGPIGIDGGIRGISTSGGTMGKKAATAVLASSSNVTLTGGTINIGSGTSIDTTGTVTVQPSGTSFTSAQTFPANLAMASTVSGLTFGKSGNIADLTIGNAQTIAGPISVYGGNVALNASLTTTPLRAGDVTLNAAGNINQAAGVAVTTNGSNAVYWADTDGNSNGYIALPGSSGSPASVITNGGGIWMGGGSGTTTWTPYASATPLTVGNGYAYSGTGFQYGVSLPGYSVVNAGTGNVSISGASTYTGNNYGIGLFMKNSTQVTGGNVTLRGIGSPSSSSYGYNWGVSMEVGSSLTASGQVDITGSGGGASASGSNNVGVYLSASSIATTTGALNITGTGGAGSGGTNPGVQLNSGATVSATSGQIGITGTGGTGGNNNDGVSLLSGNNSISTTTGAIAITGTQGASTLSEGLAFDGTSGTSTIGASNQSGNIVIQTTSLYDTSSTAGQIAGTGTLTLAPLASANSFSAAIDLTNLPLASTLTGLTVGKSTNTADLTIGRATSIAGPISLYGGSIYVNAPITETSSIDTTLLMQATGDIVDSGASITSSNAKLNMVFIADWDSTNGGTIYMNGGSTPLTLNTHGGAAWLGGNGYGTASGTTTWNGLTVGTGAATSFSTTTYAWEGVNLKGTTLTTSGGDVYVAGTNNRYNSGENRYGVVLQQGTAINTGSGNITLVGTLAQQTGTLANVPVIFGVDLENSSLQTATGNISMTGGEAATNGSYNTGSYGVRLYNSTVRTTGATGNINIAGTIGTDNGNVATMDGVQLQAYGANALTAVSTVGGNLSITGTANTASAAASNGIELLTGQSSNTNSNNPVVQVVSRTGNVTLTGDNPANTNTGSTGVVLNSINYGKIAVGYDGTNAYSGNTTVTGRSVVETNTYAGYLTLGGSGALTIQPTGNSFVRGAATGQSLDFNVSWTLGSSHSAITLGKDAGSAAKVDTLTVSNALTAAGPISLYGGTLALNANLTSTLAGANMLAKASGDISAAASTTFQTNNGNITLWSDSDASGAGAIALGDSTTFNSAGGSTTQQTGGGKITLAGGADGNADGIPDGYATSTSGSGVAFGTTNTSGTAVYSGGGDVLVQGKTSAAGGSTAYGVLANGALSVTSGQGAIGFNGQSTALYGVEFSQSASSGTGLTLRSGKTSGTAISVIGATTGSGTHGVVFDFNSVKNVLATGGGGIAINGTGTTGGTGVWLQNANVLASSGPITIDGGTAGIYSFAGTYLGSMPSSAVTASSSNILLRADAVSIANGNTLNVASTGTLTVEPKSASFSSALSWPLANIAVASGLTGLTLGKPGNTADISVTAAQNIAGPIAVYGGTINLSANLTSTAAGAGILVQASNNINTAGSTTFQTNNGDITFWSDSDASGAGDIALGNSTGFNSANASTTQQTGGGRITLAGGADSNADGIPDNFAISSSGNGIAFGTSSASSATLYSGGGDVLVKGKSSSGGGPYYGVVVNGALGVTSGQGAIAISGETAARYGVQFSNSVVGTGLTLTSAKTSGTAISITGKTTVAAGGMFGVNFDLDAVENVLATGGGGITITGTGTAGGAGVRMVNTNVLASSGAITIDGGTAGIQSSTGSSLGSKAATAITASSSNILLRGDAVAVSSGALNIASTGTLTVAPFSASFSSALNWPISNLNVTSGLTGLTLGKPGNTADITVGAAQSIAGPISVYGGNVGINSSLNATAAGDILLQASGTLTMAAGTTAQTSNGNVIATTARWLNQSGASALMAGGSGHYWQVWSSNTDPFNVSSGDVRGGLVFDYKQYGATYGSSTVLGTGNGLLYSYQPSVTASLTSSTTKVYDGGTAAALTSANYAVGGGVDGDQITLGTPGSVVYAGKDVGSGLGVTASGLTLASAQSSSATGGKAVYGYGLTSSSASGAIGSITQKALTATVAAPNKTYDGGTTATPTLSIVAGLVGNETLGVSGTASFNSKDVAAASLVTVTGTTLANGTNGGLAGNYSLVSGQTVAASITPKALSATVAAPNKTYDGSTGASPTLTLTSGLVGNETLGVGGTANFNTKDVATANLVTVASTTLANGTNGGLASNYSLAGGQTVAAGITQKALGATVAAPGRAYDGTIAATPTLTITAGLVGTETVGASGTASFNTKDVATANLVTVTGTTLVDGTNGGLAGNYSLVAGQTVASTITPKALTATVAAPSKVYDGNTAATPTLTIASGLVGTETVGASGTANFNTKDVATANLVTVASTTLANGTNGGLASNYSLAGGQTVAAGITQKALSATVAAPSRAYDGTTAATPTLTITSGLVGTETVGASGSASFNTKDVATANLVTVTGTTLVDGTNGGLAGNYSLVAGQTVASTITPKALTATVAAPSKVYDGNTAATPTLTIASGLVGTETVGASGTANFNTRDVATANLVTVASTTLANGTNGGLASNYSLAGGQTVAAGITQRTLSATVAAPGRAYDGTTAATPTLTITSGLVGTETVGASGTASFNAKDVATANLVTVTGTTLADGANGGLAGNYALAAGQTVAATITPKALTATVAAPSKVYDGSTTATPTMSIASGLVGSETVGVSGTASFNTKNVATANLVTVASTSLANGTNGGLASNYSLAPGQMVAASITPKALTATVAAPNKVYDGSTSASPTLAVTSGLVGSETVGASGIASFNSKDVADATVVTVTGTTLADGSNGGLAGNYSLAPGATVAASITPKALTTTAAAPPKVYDGSTSASPMLTIASGLVGSETLGVSAIGSYNSKDVVDATLITVAATSLANGTNGGLAGNYSLAAGQTIASTITPKALTVTIAAPGKVYDGNTSASPTLTLSSGLVGNETLGVSGSASFNSKDVADANLVTVTGTTLANGANGGLASNYSVAPGATVAASITPKALTATVAAPGKVYDGSTSASPTLTIASGLVGSETLGVSGIASFNSKDVATANLVTVTGTTLANGGNGGLAGNYSLAAGETVAAGITPKALTATVVAPTKVYDGNTTASPTLTIASGLVGSETLGVSGIASFNSKDVASANLVTVTATMLADGTNGGLAGNYGLAAGQIVASAITPKALTAVVAAPGKVYDGTTTASPTLTLTGGLVGNETLAVTGTAAFNSRNVAAANTVTVTATSLADGANGGLAGNYTLAAGQAVAAVITPRAVDVIGVSANDKVYDTGTLTTLRGNAGVTLLAGDSATVAGPAVANFADKNVGNGKAVGVTGYTLVGSDATNYALLQPVGLTATIVPAALQITGLTAQDKVYDATTAVTLGGTATVAALGADQLGLAGSANASFADRNVGSAKPIAVGGYTLTGADAANYLLAPTASVTASITPATLNLAGARIYDGSTSIAGSQLGAVGVAGETFVVTGSGAAGNLASRNVQVGQPLASVDGLALGAGSNGALAGNYLPLARATSHVDVTARPLTLGAAPVTKVYDGTTVADTNIVVVAGSLVAGDRLGGGQFAYADPNAGSAKGVSTSQVTIDDDNHGRNYSIGYATQAVGRITPAPLTVTANDDAKFVTRADGSGYNGVHYGGFVNGETAAVLGGNATIARLGSVEAPGTQTGVLVPSGLNAVNYEIRYANGSFTIVPAGQLLVRVANQTTTYGDGTAPGYTVLSAQYLDGNNVIQTLTPSTPLAGATRHYDDGAGGQATFTLGPVAGATSGAGLLKAGSYAVGATHVTETSVNFSDTLTVVGQLTVDPLALRPVLAGGASKVYDGSTAIGTLQLGLAGALAGDQLQAGGVGAFDSRNAGTQLGYTVAGLTLGGADAGNYVLLGGSRFSGSNGVITPKPVTLTAPIANKVYDGQTGYAVSAADLAALSAQLGVSGDAVRAIDVRFGDKNVGSGKAVTASGAVVDDGNGGANYVITLAGNGNGAITRLGSVTWTGGTTGNWFDPANWAGGAVPDLSNVAQVVIPAGVRVAFDDFAVPAVDRGPVFVDGLGSGGALQMQGGALNVGPGGIRLADLSQSGGRLSVQGDVNLQTFAQTGGASTVAGGFNATQGFTQGAQGSLAVQGHVDLSAPLGDVVLGNLRAAGGLDVTTFGGDIRQAAGTALTVPGATVLDAGRGDIVLGSAGNDFVGPVSARGDDVTLRDANALTLGTVTTTGDLRLASDGRLDLGRTTVGGALIASTQGGDIVQQGSLVVRGTSTLDATAGPSHPAGTAAGNIALGNVGNDFVGTVSAQGNTVTLADANALALGTVVTTGNLSLASDGPLDLGRTTVGGALAATTQGGDIVQQGPLVVRGTSNLDATAGPSRPAGTAAGNIALGNASNDFVGSVSAKGDAVTLADANALTLGTVATTGDLKLAGNGRIDLGSTTVGGALTATTLGGDIVQQGPLVVGGTSDLNAGTGAVRLADPANALSGAVLVTASTTQLTGHATNAAPTNAAETNAASTNAAETWLMPIMTAYVVPTPLATATLDRGMGLDLHAAVLWMDATSQRFAYTFPPEMIERVRRSGAVPVLQQSDGQPLPEWLRFDPATMSLSAEGMPDGELPMTLALWVEGERVLIRVAASGVSPLAAAAPRDALASRSER